MRRAALGPGLGPGLGTALAVALAVALGVGGCASGPPSTPHSPAEQADIDQAQSALDALHGLKARFTQFGPERDAISFGTAWFETGHLRLQYDPPLQRVVVAGSGRLVVHDEPSGATTRISLAANPLGLLLAGPVRLSGEIDVTDIQRSAGALQLSLDRASNPAQGLLTLLFLVRPDGTLMLSGLEAVDSQHHRTRFVLSDQRSGIALDPALFSPPG